MFDRMKLLLNDEQLTILINSKILIVGLGGVGGAVFEALVRLGIKNIDVVDGDVFEESNLNRQLLANINNIGHSKALEAKLRGLSINPSICVNCYELFLNETNIGEIPIDKYDYIIDCCDTMTTKLLLIKEALKYKVKIISSMGTGNRFDPTKLEVKSIWKTDYDPVAKIMRKLLRDNNIKDNIPVLCSKEIPVKIHNRVPGSISLVPNVAGFYIAYYVFSDIIGVGSGHNGR